MTNQITCSINATVRAATYRVHRNDPNLPPAVRGRDDFSRIVLTVERGDNGRLERVEVPNNGRRESTGEFRKLSGLCGQTVRLELDQEGSIVGAELEDE